MKTNALFLKSLKKAQRGFTLIELSFVAVILIILGAIATPYVQGYIINGKVPTAGGDIQKTIASLKQLATSTGSATPFATVPSITSLVQNSSFTTSGTTVLHGMGDSSGQVTIASVGTGAAAQITLWGLHPSACPGLANVLSKTADAVEIGQSGTTTTPTAPTAATSVPTTTSTYVVKTSAIAYNAVSAQNACNNGGNNNYMRFYISAT